MATVMTPAPNAPLPQSKAQLLLGTIALEKERWNRASPPHLALAFWLPRIAATGFDGLELWERHFLEIPGELPGATVPVVILNGYTTWGATEADELARARTLSAVQALHPRAVKFNFGPPSADAQAEIAAIQAWASLLPQPTQLLCECHPRTLAEDPHQAARLLDQLGTVAGCEPGAIIHFSSGSLETLRHWLNHLGPRICHVHLAGRDHSGKLIALRNVKDHPQRFRILQQHPVSLSYTIEFAAGSCHRAETPEITWQAVCGDVLTLRAFV
jgi:hypothetical protein